MGMGMGTYRYILNLNCSELQNDRMMDDRMNAVNYMGLGSYVSAAENNNYEALRAGVEALPDLPKPQRL